MKTIEELTKAAEEYEAAANMFAAQAKEHMDMAMQNIGAAGAIRELIKDMGGDKPPINLAKKENQ